MYIKYNTGLKMFISPDKTEGEKLKRFFPNRFRRMKPKGIYLTFF